MTEIAQARVDEEWRSIPGFSDYAISTLGRVRRETRARGAVQGSLLALYAKKGYWSACLTTPNSGQTFCLVHRIVASVFIPNPTSLPEVNHKNGDKSDNSISNLEWCSRRDNVRHAFRIGLVDCRGERNGRAKLTDDAVRQIRAARGAGSTQQQIAAAFGLTQAAISQLLLGKTWKHVA